MTHSKTFTNEQNPVFHHAGICRRLSSCNKLIPQVDQSYYCLPPQVRAEMKGSSTRYAKFTYSPTAIAIKLFKVLKFSTRVAAIVSAVVYLTKLYQREVSVTILTDTDHHTVPRACPETTN